MKYLTNLQEGNFDNIYASNGSFGNLLSSSETISNLIITSSTSANLICSNLTSSNIKSTSITSGNIFITSASLHVIAQNGISNIKLYSPGLAVNSGNSWGMYIDTDYSLSFYYQNAGGAFYNNLQLNQNNNAVFIGGISCASMSVLNGDLTCSGGNLVSRGLKTMSEIFTQSSQSSSTGITLTASMCLSGLINRTSVNAGQTDTLDSPANFVTAFLSINTGYVLKIYYWNNSSNSVTLDSGSGAINGSTTLTNGKIYEIRLVFTSTSSYYVIVS